VVAQNGLNEETVEALHTNESCPVEGRSLQFITQTGVNPGVHGTRKAIRRHVMLGKNRGPPKNPKQPTIRGSGVFRLDDSPRPDIPKRSVVPRRAGTDLSFLNFADDINHSQMGETIRFCRATTEILFVLEPCISFNSTGIAQACVQLFSSDPLHMNLMALGICAYKDQVHRQTTPNSLGGFSKIGLYHYGKALSLLRERLTGPPEVSDVTIMAVVVFAMHSLFSGEAARPENMRSDCNGL
jgi:hypothetical protein